MGRSGDHEKADARQKVKKRPGCSWIELEKKIHVYVAEDMSHPMIKEIYKFWEDMSEKMKKT